MINASRNWLKAFLALGVRKVGSSIAPIFCTSVNFLDKFMIISLALPLPPPTISLSSALNAFEANSLDDPVVFNKEISGAAILLKP